MAASDSLSVPLLDVSRDNQPLRDECLAAMARVWDSGKFISGPDCQVLEQTLAELCGADHAIGCASGSDALLLALMALDVGPGDEVIVPSFTFFATASCVMRLGAIPVFVDVDESTYNLSPEAVAEAVTPRTKAIIPVHLFGQCADLAALQAIADRHGLALIEDCAQSIGATYQDKTCGSWGAMGCFSFYPTKNLGGFGDAGLVTTCNAELADRLRLFANHGMRPRYFHQVVGINSRLDSLQAALLNVKIPHLVRWGQQRSWNAQAYQVQLAGLAEEGLICLPVDSGHGTHVWNQFTIRIPGGRRDQIRQQLSEAQVGTEVYYPIPLHLQQCFSDLGYRPGSLPVTERLSQEVLSLPIFPGLTTGERQWVCRSLERACRQVATERRRAA